MTDKQQEALTAVQLLNEELWKKYDKKHKKDDWTDWHSKCPILTCVIGQYHVAINLTIQGFPEIPLYNSWAEEERIYYERSDKYETFYKFIKRKFREIKEELNTIKI